MRWVPLVLLGGRWLDAPARRGAALSGRSVLADQLLEAALVDHLRAELLGLRQLRAGAVARDHIVGLLRDRVDDLSAREPDQPGGLLAAEVGQGARQHERLAVERAALLAALRGIELHPQARPAEPLDQLPGAFLRELFVDLLGEDRTDALGLLDV